VKPQGEIWAIFCPNPYKILDVVLVAVGFWGMGGGGRSPDTSSGSRNLEHLRWRRGSARILAHARGPLAHSVHTRHELATPRGLEALPCLVPRFLLSHSPVLEASPLGRV
jgi:hypothetical protein